MVSIKVGADATALVKGDESLERFPIVAKILGSGKDGSLGVKVSAEVPAPVSATVSLNSEKPISVAPITVVPDLRLATEALNLEALVASLARLSEGLNVSVSGQGGKPLSLSLGKIPVDLTISVVSPANEKVFNVEIKGSVGSDSGE
jgi:hypothetical protein